MEQNVQVALDKKGCNFNSFCVATSAALMNTVGGIISRSVEQVSKPSWFQVLFLYCCFFALFVLQHRHSYC
jgi:hypothetical protein